MEDTRRRQDAEPPVKMQSVKKIWRWSCKGQFATIVTPGAKSEETLVPSQSVIGEIKMASILRTTPAPTVRPAACVASASNSWNGRASQSAIGGKKFSAGCTK